MKCHYVSIHSVGFSINGPERELVSIPQLHIRASLTDDPGPIRFHLDRARAVANTLAMSMVGQLAGTDREASVREQTDQIARSRSRYGAAVVFQAVTDVDPDLQHRIDFSDFSVLLHAFDSAPLKESFRATRDGVLAAMSLASSEEDDATIELVDEGAYLVDQNGRTLYNVTITASGVARVFRGNVDQRLYDFVAAHTETLAQNDTLTKICGLLTHSLELKRDRLHAFLSAWTALEIFVNHTYSAVYETRWFGHLAGSAPSSTAKYFRRIREVLKDRHRLNDKFVIVASLLKPDEAEQDGEMFELAKKQRDAFFHGEPISDDQFLTKSVQALLRKYLRLHLSSSQ